MSGVSQLAVRTGLGWFGLALILAGAWIVAAGGHRRRDLLMYIVGAAVIIVGGLLLDGALALVQAPP